MARKLDTPPNAIVFLAILLTALVMSAVLTRARAQTAPDTTPPAVSAPATPEVDRPVTPTSEAEASCRAIGNAERRAQCLAELNRDGTLRPSDTPPPPAELRRDLPSRERNPAPGTPSR